MLQETEGFLNSIRPISPQITYPYPLYKMEDDIAKNKLKQNQVNTVYLYGIRIVSLAMDGKERLCLAQISNTLLKEYSYNEIHNRRVALGITCVQCTPVQLEILRRAGAMPISSRRCGMITRREAERLCKSFLGDNAPPKLPENFAFEVYHECAWGSRGQFVPSRYNSSRAKCIKCHFCGVFFSPNKFVFHSHRLSDSDKYIQPDAANFNSWRRHTKLLGDPPEEIVHAWEDIKAMFNGGTRKRILSCIGSQSQQHQNQNNLALPSTSSSPQIATAKSVSSPLAGSLGPSHKMRKKEVKEEATTIDLPHGKMDLPNPGISLPYLSRFQSIESLIASSKPSLNSKAECGLGNNTSNSLLPFPFQHCLWNNLVPSSNVSRSSSPPPSLHSSPWNNLPYPIFWNKRPFLDLQDNPFFSNETFRDSKQSRIEKPNDAQNSSPFDVIPWFDKRRTEEAILSSRAAACAAAAAAALTAQKTSASSEADPNGNFPHFSAFRPVSTFGTGGNPHALMLLRNNSSNDSNNALKLEANPNEDEDSCAEVSTTVEVNERDSSSHEEGELYKEKESNLDKNVKNEPQDFSIIKIVSKTTLSK